MPSDPNRSVPKAILIGAIIAAVLDMLDPIIFYGLRGIPARQIPQAIASGILGRASYSDGIPSVLLGLAAHLFIALVWATLFVLAARSLPFLTRHAVVAGLLYGGFIYVVMYYLVLPHTNLYPRNNPNPGPAVLVNSIAAMVLLVGRSVHIGTAMCSQIGRRSTNCHLLETNGVSHQPNTTADLPIADGEVKAVFNGIGGTVAEREF